MKKILLILLTLVSFSASAQVYQAQNGYGFQYKHFKIDSTLHIPTFCGTPTLRGSVVGNQGAIAIDSCNHKLFWYDPKDSSWNVATGGSGGGITKVYGGYAITEVNDSTVAVDTATLSTIYLQRKDSTGTGYVTDTKLRDTAAAIRNDFPTAGSGIMPSDTATMLSPYIRDLTLTTSGTIFPSSTVASASSHKLTLALTLNSQSAYTLFGRGSGSGSPSFLTSIDSNWIPTLHSKSYYDALYLLPSQTGNSGKYLTTDGSSPSWGTVVASAAGSNTYVQFNDGGTLGGDSTFTFDKTTGILHFTKTGSGNYIEFAANSTGTAPTIKLFYSGGTGKTIGINSLNNLTASGVFASGGNLKATALIVGANPTAISGNVATTTPTTGSIILAPTGGDSYIYYFNSGAFSAAAAGTSSSTGDYIHYRNPTGFGFNGTEVYRIVRSTGDLLKGTSTDVTSSTATIASTTQGAICAPVMTTTQRNAIASPAEGLQVYDSTLHKLCVYDGTTWQAAW